MNLMGGFRASMVRICTGEVCAQQEAVLQEEGSWVSRAGGRRGVQGLEVVVVPSSTSGPSATL